MRVIGNACMPAAARVNASASVHRLWAPGWRRQRGQATVEYVVVGVFALIILLAIPVPGLDGPNNESVIAWLIDVLHRWWSNYSYMISLP